MPEAPYRGPQPPEPEPPRSLSPLERLAQEGAAVARDQRNQEEKRAREERAKRLDAVLLPPLTPEWQQVSSWLLVAGLATSLIAWVSSWQAIWLVPALVASAVLLVWERRRRKMTLQRPALLAKALGWPTTLPFSLTGYERWLTCDFGAVNVHFRGPVDHQLAALAVRAVAPASRLRWQSEQHLLIGLPSKYLWSDGDDACMGGDPEAIQQLAARVLSVFHAEIGLEKVELTEGYVPPDE